MSGLKTLREKFDKCDWFLLLFIAYNKGAFFPGIISRLILMVILAVCIYYFIYANTHYRSSYLTGLNGFLALITLYGFVYVLSGEDIMGISNYTYLTNNYVPLLPIFPLYVFSRKGLLTADKVEKWFVVFLLVVIATFFIRQRNMLAADVIGQEEFTNNIGYTFVALMPLIFFVRKSLVLRYIYLLLILGFIILGMKRGAILIAGLSLVFILFYSFRNVSRNGKIALIVLSVALLFGIYLYGVHLFNDSAYFQLRIERTLEGSSSGRDDMYSKALNHFLNSDVVQFFVGNGANKTYLILGNRAHNDWLELAINQGLVGVLVYFFYWLIIFYYVIKAKRYKDVFPVMALFAFIYFAKSMISMSYDAYELYSCIAIAWSVAEIDKRRILKKNKIPQITEVQRSASVIQS